MHVYFSNSCFYFLTSVCSSSEAAWHQKNELKQNYFNLCFLAGLNLEPETSKENKRMESDWCK